jgi:6-pyruvoyltetrahydropterin/6-carboxytetrahydropterin synthase
MYSITKDIYFCYGHRLMGHPGKCKHLHGHSVKAAITIVAEALNDQGMVCDFSEVTQAAQKFIDETLDHNFLIHREDPLVPALAEAKERFLLVDEHPTAEFLARMIFEAIRKEGLNVTRVTLWETTSASASYVEDR